MVGRQRKRPPEVKPNSSTSKRKRNEETTALRPSIEELRHLTLSTGCGKILHVHLTNFMCHSNLSIDLDQRINFLVGSNGSGKSAIMAALTVGLGAKARATSRSSNIQQLIKSGENTAKIEIIVTNEGPHGYEPETYGKHITIVRTLHRSGSSTYAIKNDKGYVITKKNSVLQRILTYHNVQVDNPIFMLNQDYSREFLKELDPKKNYQLFLRASQIQSVYDKLIELQVKRKTDQHEFDVFKMKIEKGEREVKTLEKKLDHLRSIKELNQNLKTTEVKLAWVKVTNHEKELQNYMEKYNQVREQQQSLIEKMQTKDATRDQLMEKIKKYGEELSEKTTEYSSENAILAQLKREQITNNERWLEMQNSIQSLKRRIDNVKEQINDLRTNIDERSKQNTTDYEKMRHDNEATLAELHERLQVETETVQELKSEVQTMVTNKIQVEQKVNPLIQEKDTLTNKIRFIENKLSNVSASSRDNLALYGERVGLLVQEINKLHKMGKFSALPRGPIGRYIQVPNDQYRDIVEMQLRGILLSYIVNNTEDRLLLERILREKFPNFEPPIITTKFLDKVYDVSKGAVNPPRGTTLLMNEIKCTDPVVMNCVIDRIQAETTLLAESKKIAEQITGNAENVPVKLSKVLVPQHGLEYYPVPHYRMYSVNIRPANYIQINVQDRISQLKAEKNSLIECIKKIDMEKSRIGNEINHFNKHLSEKRTNIEHIEINIRDLNEKISMLTKVDYPDYNEIELLENDMKQLKSKCDDYEAKLNDKEKHLKDTKTATKSINDKVTTQLTKLQKLHTEIDQMKKKRADLQHEMLCLDDMNKNYKQKLNKLKTDMDQSIIGRKEIEKRVNDAKATAQTSGDRIDSDCTEAELLQLVERCKNKLKRYGDIKDDPDELRKLIDAKRELIKDDTLTFENLDKSLNLLDCCINQRHNYLEELKHRSVDKIVNAFQRFLKIRDFTGTIVVDHKNQIFDVNVIPRDKNVANAVNSTKALSGGERSFSTVALLISMWECVYHPFYFLDEYDVYTDDVNRDVLTRMLVNEGIANPDRQYVFLTPQALELETADYIKIHKLSPPSRT